jgi:hypothetical protein
MIVFDGMEAFVPNWRDPAVLHLRRPRGPDRLSGKTFLLRLWCVTTDWPDWGNLVTVLRVRPHVDQWTIRTVTLESNQETQQCFSHLNQVADFGYRRLLSCCIYSNCVASWCETSGWFFCGEVVKTLCKMIRHNGPVFIWCRKSIYNVETMNLQLFER